MAEYTREQMMTALRGADAAGNAEEAKQIAHMISKQDDKTFDMTSVMNNDNMIRFDKSTQVPAYQRSLKKMYGAEMPDASFEDLAERNHEYFNSIDWNSVSGLKTLYDVTNDMDEDQLKAFVTNKDMFTNVAATGPGSRGTGEQLKDAFQGIFTDPLTYATLGIGKVVAGKATQLTTKEAIKLSIAQKLKSYGAKNAGLMAAASGEVTALDAIQQGIEIATDPTGQQTYDPVRAAKAAALGGTIGILAPAVLKGGAKVIGATGAGIRKTADTLLHPIEGAKSFGGGVIKSFGGKGAAKKGIEARVEEVVGKGDATQGAATLARDTASAEAKANSYFTEQYDNLGDFDVDVEGLTKIIDDLRNTGGIKKSMDLTDINDALTLLKEGNLTPTQALRQIRSDLGSASRKAAISGSGSRRVLQGYNEKVRKFFSESAVKAGKGEEAGALDKSYSNYLKVKGDKDIQSLLVKNDKGAHNLDAAASAATTIMTRVLGKKTPHEARALFKKLEAFEEATGDVGFAKRQREALQQAAAEKITRGSDIVAALKTKGQREILEEVFEGRVEKASWKYFADILENADDHTGAMEWVTRVIGGAAGEKVISGPAGMIGGLGLTDKLLNSTIFRGLAMRAFSSKPATKEKALKGISKFMDSKGYSADQVQAIKNSLIGGSVIGGATVSATGMDTEVYEGLRSAFPDLAEYFK